MNYVHYLIANGTNFRVERKVDTASFRPASSSEGDLAAFQSVVHDIRAREGDGYRIRLEHPVSTRGRGLVDLVIVNMETNQRS